MTKRILLIDNYDSFVYKLGDEFARLHGEVSVYRANLPLNAALHIIEHEQPDLLVMSPGPGSPQEATLCMQLLAHAPHHLPIFGVCLGHQCIIEHFGGRVRSSGAAVHGKASMVTHNNQSIFAGLPNPLPVGRYHSLIGEDIPTCLTVDARACDIVMAISHQQCPIYGVQFHPENILTLYRLIK